MRNKLVSLLAAGLMCLPALQVLRAAERNTLIFISDLHMNTDVSYGWLKTNTTALATFIQGMNAREDVAELIILGDMLDDWIETVENAPHTFRNILVSPNNAEIVAALRAVCQNPEITVTYVVGNHDLLTFKPENKTAITNILPGLNIISDEPGLGAYTKNNVIWAEHGHRYCMFNAPDVWSRPGGHLPLGYFISRIAASKSAREGKLYTTFDAIDAIVQSYSSYTLAGEDRAKIINALFDAFALVWGHYWPWDTFTMGNTDHFTNNPSVLHIGNVFDGIYSNWPSQMNTVEPAEAVANELGDLSGAAALLFEMPERIQDKYPFTPRIVLFGHTHKADLLCQTGALNSIYANSGTWVDGKPGSWVEIEINRFAKRDFYTVSLWFNGEAAPRRSATLDIPQLTANGPFQAAAQDFDGDRLADPALIDAGGNWHFWSSSDSYERKGHYAFGINGLAVAGDFDGDRRADPVMAVNSLWYIWFSGSEYQLAGGPFDCGVAGLPVAGDFDGDRRADPVMVVNSLWYIWFSGSEYQLAGGPFDCGVAGTPVAGDFDGDRRADPVMAVNSLWYIWFSGSQYQLAGCPFDCGVAGVPATGDFDGDGLADPAMVDFDGNWHIWFSKSDYAPSGPLLLK
ncbi:MAG: metallophosphoesterase [Kiritimatiellae bacterium]|nr:metallophosphoesterase [Kiritimatiellia bacterium]